jgi:uncharacterized protein YbbC (DUF1343 family)
MITLPRFITILLIGLVTLGLAIFILYEVRGVSYGPHIEVLAPINGSTIEGLVTDMTGTVRNVVRMEINGQTIIPYTDNTFSYTLILMPELNTVQIRAWDKFQKYDEVILQLWGVESPKMPAVQP